VDEKSGSFSDPLNIRIREILYARENPTFQQWAINWHWKGL